MRVTMEKPLRLGIDWALHALEVITVCEGDSLVVDDDFAQGMMHSNVDRPCIVLQIGRFVAIPKDDVHATPNRYQGAMAFPWSHASQARCQNRINTSGQSWRAAPSETAYRCCGHSQERDGGISNDLVRACTRK